MAIAYFPKLYEDELIYSVLARYFVHEGFLLQKDAKMNLFVSPYAKIEMEFMKKLNQEVIKVLLRDYSINNLIENHTMYPYYRFLDEDRRKTAYQAVVDMDGDYSKLFGFSTRKKGEKRYLRYCPCCAREDREKQGETYWHRIHQLRGMEICSKHRSVLIQSEVIIDSNVNEIFQSAEFNIPYDDEEYKSRVISDKELDFAKYMKNVFEQKINMSGMAKISGFLRYRMIGTDYISESGKYVFIQDLWKNICDYYNSMNIAEKIASDQIHRVLLGKNTSFFDVCIIAHFLKVGERELVEYGSYEYVKKDKDRRSEHLSRKQQPKRRDWDYLDKRNVNRVKKAIVSLHGNENKRPSKISFYSVSKESGLSINWLKKMKSCKTIIENAFESDEKYNARKVLFAYEQLQREGVNIKFWKINTIAKITRKELVDSFPYMDELATEDIVMDLKKRLS